MIGNNELRLGNLIDTPKGICTLNKNIFCLADFNLLNPIPITEEWLKKLGFNFTEKSDDGYCRYDNENCCMEIWPINPNENCNGKWEFRMEGIEVEHEIELDFVHELQNLYYAIFKEELNYENIIYV